MGEDAKPAYSVVSGQAMANTEPDEHFKSPSATQEVRESKPEEHESEKMEVSESAAEVMSENSPTKGKETQKKFTRIRTHVQNINEEFLATLYETEQRHKKEIESYKSAMASQEKKHQEEFSKKQEELRAKQKKELSELYEQLQALETSHKSEISELNEKLQALETSHKESSANTEKLHKSEIKHVEHSHKSEINNLEQRHKDVMKSLYKQMDEQKSEFQSILYKEGQRHKAAMKELHGKFNAQARKHEDFKKRAGEKVKKLTQKLLEKHDDLEAFEEKALKEVDMMAEALARSKSQVTTLEASLEKVQKQYLEEYEKRKADEKKIVSLRKMIEQYDGGDMDESMWADDLSVSKSDDDIALKELHETPSSQYHNSVVKDQEEFEKLHDSINAIIPEGIKKHFRQVGFHETEGIFFPVLGLSPFDVPPGPLREKWLENADKSLGIFYYGQPDENIAYAMIPPESFIPYDEGVKRDLHITPLHIIEKQQEGLELTSSEQLLADSITKVNMEARTTPEDRKHILDDFEEDFVFGNATAQARVELENLRNSLKAKLSFGDTAAERATLMAEMDDIMNDDESEDETQVMEDFKAAEEEEDACRKSAFDEQVDTFIKELSASASGVKIQCEERHDESRESKANYSSQEDETRDNEVVEETPSYERMQKSSIVQKRLAMFDNGKQTAKPKFIIDTGNTKNVMNMWKQKAAESITPKQGNVTPRKAFVFNDVPSHKEKPTDALDTPRKLKKTNSSSSVSTAGSTASSRTRRVTIPKKIVTKIEAGEPLSDDEREILEGIQKFNSIKTPTASSMTAATAE